MMKQSSTLFGLRLGRLNCDTQFNLIAKALSWQCRFKCTALLSKWNCKIETRRTLETLNTHFLIGCLYHGVPEHSRCSGTPRLYPVANCKAAIEYLAAFVGGRVIGGLEIVSGAGRADVFPVDWKDCFWRKYSDVILRLGGQLLVLLQRPLQHFGSHNFAQTAGKTQVYMN